MGGYKEHNVFDILKRKNIIIKYLVFIVIIFVVTALFIIQVTQKSEVQKDIVYTENSNLEYKVYLKENDFFDKSYLEEENQYIASLIDFIEADFKYELVASEKDIDYRYTYTIVAEVNVEDKTTHKSLYEFDEDLIELKEYNHNTNTKLIIKEPIKIDYNRYNDIIKRFVNLYDLDNSVASVTVNMYVNLLEDSNAESTKSRIPAVSLTIPLTTETMAIDIESNETLPNNINVYKNIEQSEYLFGAIIFAIIDIILIVKFVIFLNDTKNEKAVYNMRLRKIMSNYGSYIQKLNNEFDFEGYQILEIKSFEDLLQIKETLNKPILVTEKESAMETYFFIPSDFTCYIYELKAGNLREKRGKRYKVHESVEEINIRRIEELGLHKNKG